MSARRLFSRWSLSVRLVVASLVVETVMLSVLLFTSVHITTDRLADQLETRLSEMESLLEASLVVPLIERDFGAMQDVLSALRRRQGVDYLVLVDRQGAIVAADGWTDGTPLPAPHRGEDRYDLQLPITLGGTQYGRLHYGVPTRFLATAERSLLGTGIAIAAAEILLSAGLLWLIGTLLTRRLRAVIHTTEDIAAGNLGARYVDGGADEVHRLGRSLNIMADALEARLRESLEAEERLTRTVDALSRSNADLERFAYVASHDLQEPLRLVISYCQLLERRYGDRLDGDAREFLGYITEGARRMVDLVKGLLEFSRIESQPRRGIPVDAATSVREAWANLAVAAEEGGAEFVCGDLPMVTADPVQLVQLFQNLLSNAIKYRCHGRPLRIAVSCRKDGEMWEFAVTDNGIGIESNYFDQIFVVFKRLHTRQEIPGTGIGLALCKRIVEHHGGRIWVESVAGEGSTFRFTLPAG
jgi:signal transduction histidine kinase